MSEPLLRTLWLPNPSSPVTTDAHTPPTNVMGSSAPPTATATPALSESSGIEVEDGQQHAPCFSVGNSVIIVVSIDDGGKEQEGEHMSSAEWITIVCMPPIFIFGTAGAANIAYNKPFWSGFPWWLPVILLAGVYPTVVFLAMGHITLFLPEAPFAAQEALFNVGYKGIGLAVAVTSAFSLLFVDHPWVLIAWACLQSALIAAIFAFWVYLVRPYGKQGTMGIKS